MTTDVDLDTLSKQEREAIETEYAHMLRDDLRFFVREAWRIVEPGRELVENKHIDVICKKLMAVDRGEIQNLVICIPPGFMKSLLVSVFFPAWQWLRRPWLRSMYLSGSDKVRKRDSRRCRDIIQSQWYERVIAILNDDAWTLKRDQNEKVNFANTEGGFRQTNTVLGKITGDRADQQVLDDPYDVKEATRGTEQRIAERMREVIEIWDTVLSSRLNDKRDGTRIVIMQRLHEMDLAGELLERDDYEALVLPMEYDPEHEYLSDDDWRTDKGELLFPEMFPREVVESIKTELRGQYAAQANQAPKSREGDMYKRAWFTDGPHTIRKDTVYYKLPDLSEFDKVFQSWDFSAGSKSSDASYVAGHIFGIKWPEVWLFPIEQRGQWSFTEMKDAVTSMTKAYPDVRLKLVERKASGGDVVDDMKREIGGFVLFEPGTHGSKDVRADIASDVPEGGDLRIPHSSIAPWIWSWIDEVCAFPSTPNDRVDTLSQAVIYAKRFKPSRRGRSKARSIGSFSNPFG